MAAVNAAESPYRPAFDADDFLLFVGLVPLWLLLANLLGLYHLSERRIDLSFADELGPGFLVMTLWSWFWLVGRTAIHVGPIAVLPSLVLWAAGILLVPTFRSILHRLARDRSWYRQPVALIGSPSAVERVRRRIGRHPGIRARRGGDTERRRGGKRQRPAGDLRGPDSRPGPRSRRPPCDRHGMARGAERPGGADPGADQLRRSDRPRLGRARGPVVGGCPPSPRGTADADPLASEAGAHQEPRQARHGPDGSRSPARRSLSPSWPTSRSESSSTPAARSCFARSASGVTARGSGCSSSGPWSWVRRRGSTS